MEKKVCMDLLMRQQGKLRISALTPIGQKLVLDLVANVVASMPDEMGQGLYYWEPIMFQGQRGNWSESIGLLDEKGPSWIGVLSFLFMRMMLRKTGQRFTSQTNDRSKDEVCTLPEMLPVLLYDGTVE